MGGHSRSVDVREEAETMKEFHFSQVLFGQSDARCLGYST
jgi:hypothetical protein